MKFNTSIKVFILNFKIYRYKLLDIQNKKSGSITEKVMYYQVIIYFIIFFKKFLYFLI